MQNEIITAQRQQIQQQGHEISIALFNEFVQWINRPEQTTRTYLKNLKQFLAWLKYSGITQPTRADIINFQKYLATEHNAITLALDTEQGWKFRTDRNGNMMLVKYSANTVRQYLRSVCQLFTWLADTTGAPNIARNIRFPKLDSNATHKRQALPLSAVSEIEHSITAAAAQGVQEAAEQSKDTAGRIQRTTEQGKRLFAMYLLAVNAGLRTIEISRAKVKDLETRAGQTWLYVWGKGHAEPDRKQPLAPEVAAALKEYLASRKDKPTSNSPLFAATGNRSGGKAIAATTISTMLKKAMKQAGYDSERLTAHSLRHTAATNVLDVTSGNIYTTQQYLRHESPRTTEIYIHETEATEKANAGVATQLYNHYHGIKADAKSNLQSIIDRMSAEQLQKLEDIASAIL